MPNQCYKLPNVITKTSSSLLSKGPEHEAAAYRAHDYAAGLSRSEVAELKPSDMGSHRMLIRNDGA